jgi:outer membrane protein OmpA-like peptidoglycan-associated protein
VPAFLHTLPLGIVALVTIGVMPQPQLGPHSSSAPLLPFDWPQKPLLALSAAKPTTGLQKANSAPQLAAASATGRSDTPAVSEPPPFLRRPLVFNPNSLELDAAATKSLQHHASWLRAHAESRILIVGSCDKSGSESCTHTLAEARGAAVRKFLESCGVSPDQIVGVKGWDSADHECHGSDPKCQQQGRSVQLLLAPSAPK